MRSFISTGTWPVMQGWLPCLTLPLTEYAGDCRRPNAKPLTSDFMGSLWRCGWLDHQGTSTRPPCRSRSRARVPKSTSPSNSKHAWTSCLLTFGRRAALISILILPTSTPSFRGNGLKKLLGLCNLSSGSEINNPRYFTHCVLASESATQGAQGLQGWLEKDARHLCELSCKNTKSYQQLSY